MGASNAGVVSKIAILDEYLAIGSMNAKARQCSLPHTTESCLSQPAVWTTTTKRTEQNNIWNGINYTVSQKVVHQAHGDNFVNS